jgi:hypothetical protein
VMCEFVSFISRDRSLSTRSQACRRSHGSFHLQRVGKRARMERDALCADWVCVHLLHHPCATPVLLCCWLGSTHLLHASCAAHATPVLTLSAHACCTLPCSILVLLPTLSAHTCCSTPALPCATRALALLICPHVQAAASLCEPCAPPVITVPTLSARTCCNGCLYDVSESVAVHVRP